MTEGRSTNTGGLYRRKGGGKRSNSSQEGISVVLLREKLPRAIACSGLTNV
jgi:hypothetical protein